MDWLPLKEFWKYFLHEQHPKFRSLLKNNPCQPFLHLFGSKLKRKLFSLYTYYLMKIRILYTHTFLQIFCNPKQHFYPFCTKIKKLSRVGGVYECHYHTVLSWILHIYHVKIFKEGFRILFKENDKIVLASFCNFGWGSTNLG